MPRKQSISKDQLDVLLSWLDVDREKAGEKYAKLHAKLVTLFQSKGVLSAEDRADEVFNRIARRLCDPDETRAIQTDKPQQFILGVARIMALRERGRGIEAKNDSIEQMAETLEISDPRSSGLAEDLIVAEESELRAKCLEKCLITLGEEDRWVLQEYYALGGNHDSASHSELAKRLGLTSGGLRSRISRTKDKLGACVRKCVNGRK